MFNTDDFYQESCKRGFVKVDAIARKIAWQAATEWGDLQITINLSKPEKDPRDIAAAKTQQQKVGYVDPATGVMRSCPLCVTNHDIKIGYAKLIEIGNEKWAMWYSPYAYYNEHCIAMSWEHRPMHIDCETFSCLFDFVDLFPHYFIGSNAELPIVGGSILNHDHFQGGRHVFPMQNAPIVEHILLESFSNVEIGIVKWPLSVFRLRSSSREAILEIAGHILEVWRNWNDPLVGIVSHTETGAKSVPHNTITPILRRDGNSYEMDLALRCNITSLEHPLGVFHPHEELHHIKKENIGLIEVMGLAILPPRVQQVMTDCGMNCSDVGHAFAQVLEHSGVFKWDEVGRAALHRFIDAL